MHITPPVYSDVPYTVMYALIMTLHAHHLIQVISAYITHHHLIQRVHHADLALDGHRHGLSRARRTVALTARHEPPAHPRPRRFLPRTYLVLRVLWPLPCAYYGLQPLTHSALTPHTCFIT
eukprot:scaffold80186_cov43-Phaeocystis_antarctica.AAC.2